MTIFVGDCRVVMAGMDAESVDSVVCDPPYGLGFMAAPWDTFAPERVATRSVQNRRKTTERTSERWPDKVGHKRQGGGVAISYDESPTGNQRFQAWCTEWATECLRILKPGGHMVVFGGPRTFHRLTSGLEDAGFEIRDVLSWMFGSGFPKSHNLHGDWEGWGTALKPGWEPIVLARKPLIGTVAGNVAAHGVGALNIDGSRIGEGGHLRWSEPRDMGYHGGTDHAESVATSASAGRWPANVILDETSAALLDATVGTLAPSRFRPQMKQAARANQVAKGGEAERYRENVGVSDSGGPSRFYYTAKTSKSERDAGLHMMGRLPVHTDGPGVGEGASPKAPSLDRNTHPTVKPIALMRWLVRLVTPPGGRVFDPFTGSGTTGCAALIEGFTFDGSEIDPTYADIARRRITHWRGPLFDQAGAE